MTKKNEPGFLSQQEVDEFFESMNRMQNHEQLKDRSIDGRWIKSDDIVGNSRHYQARLPQEMHQKFFKLLEQQNWPRSTGVQYAIYSLLKPHLEQDS